MRGKGWGGRAHPLEALKPPPVTSRLCSLLLKVVLVGSSPNPSSCHFRYLTIWPPAASPTAPINKSSTPYKWGDSLPPSPRSGPPLTQPPPGPHSPPASQPLSAHTGRDGLSSPLGLESLHILLPLSFCCWRLPLPPPDLEDPHFSLQGLPWGRHHPAVSASAKWSHSCGLTGLAHGSPPRRIQFFPPVCAGVMGE